MSAGQQFPFVARAAGLGAASLAPMLPVTLVSAVVGSFAPVRLAFAWSSDDTVPVILGQVNFFFEFDVCFFRSRRVFEVRAAQRPIEFPKE